MASRTLTFPKGLVRSAGAVVWRPAPGVKVVPGQPVSPSELEFLIVHRPRYRDWSWPKGKAERNETVPVAAAREVEEETGYPVILGAPLDDATLSTRLGAPQRGALLDWNDS
jgi:8-oxo-dGTP pyrophosphatase MutT (NUDIX family)